MQVREYAICIPFLQRERRVSLSEAEIEARLALLRQRREGLDREIADLVLYRELGRRFGAAGTRTEAASEPAFDPPSVPPTNRAASALVRAQPGPRSAGHADDPEAGGAIQRRRRPSSPPL